ALRAKRARREAPLVVTEGLVIDEQVAAGRSPLIMVVHHRSPNSRVGPRGLFHSLGVSGVVEGRAALITNTLKARRGRSDVFNIHHFRLPVILVHFAGSPEVRQGECVGREFRSVVAGRAATVEVVGGRVRRANVGAGSVVVVAMHDADGFTEAALSV